MTELDRESPDRQFWEEIYRVPTVFIKWRDVKLNLWDADGTIWAEWSDLCHHPEIRSALNLCGGEHALMRVLDRRLGLSCTEKEAA